ncbi:hypothetical protein PsorP6_015355 [Peronosclerospora sorghi]|uniref:Uncharacterized protein n=1 Tax=Peronosclerospora sorghi TaxID=230839 RepID=A0ACC0WNH4_9STRA|nr:hypothetical protein PsorP6_015355 [Peronosclerospora sorghi]
MNGTRRTQAKPRKKTLFLSVLRVNIKRVHANPVGICHSFGLFQVFFHFCQRENMKLLVVFNDANLNVRFVHLPSKRKTKHFV